MPQRINAPEDVKSYNLAAILQLIREGAVLYRTDIATKLDLSPSTVSRLVDELIELNLVSESDELGPSTDRGGRRPVALQFNAQAGYLIGVDLGGTNMVGGVAYLDGTVIERRKQRSRLHGVGERNGDESLERLAALIQELRALCPEPEKIWGVGIGVPSITLKDAGIVVWAPAFGWCDLPLRELLEAELDLPVFVENDVNLAALGEYKFGVGRSTQNLVVIFVGTGIGAGIILNGRLYRGATQASGELGYMAVGLDSLGKHYDQFGCLESAASGLGIARRAQEGIKAGADTDILDRVDGDVKAVTAAHVFTAARAGDPLATEVVEETVRYYALAIANVACILDPEMIILGGGVTRSADMLLDGIKELIAGVVPRVPRIVASSLGKDAILQGAFAMVLQEISEVNWTLT